MVLAFDSVLRVGVGVRLLLVAALRVGVGDRDFDDVRLAVPVLLRVAVVVALLVALAVAERLPVGEAVDVDDGTFDDGECVGVRVMVGTDVAVSDGDGEGDGVVDGDTGDGVIVCELVGVGDGTGLTPKHGDRI